MYLQTLVRLVESESILADRYLYKARLALNKPVAQSQPRHLHLLGPVYETNFLVNPLFQMFVHVYHSIFIHVQTGCQ